MRLIDADALTETLNDVILNDTTCPIHIAATVEQYIDYAPTVDAEPVRHGHWIEKADEYYKMMREAEVPEDDIPYFIDADHFACSECGSRTDNSTEGVEYWSWCPYCGARMDGGNTNGT